MSSNNNEACCTTKPFTAAYQPKGSFTRIVGYDAYQVGSSTEPHALIIAFDIFKFSAQAMEGADMLAERGFRVVMPDFFKGATIDAACFGPNATEASQQTIQRFFSGPANPKASLEPLSAMVKELRAAGHKKVSGVGFCWGAKLCILASNLDAVALVHPSMLAPEDGEAVAVPICVLSSADEDTECIQSITASCRKSLPAASCKFEHYEDRSHGWAMARADLASAKGRADFDDTYGVLAEFLGRI